MKKNKRYILDYTITQLTGYLNKLGLKSFLAKQIFDWIYKKHKCDFADMTNISQQNREILAKEFNILPFSLAEEKISEDESAVKYKFALNDGFFIETVILKEKNYYTCCISSQAGCSLGCRFCVTGLTGFKRNLKASEIIGQVLFAYTQGYPISHIVFMGMGEPLLNLDEVLRSINIFTDPLAFNISKRKITVSTIGILSSIKRLIEEDLVLNLALSIGSANPIKRESLIPAEKNNPLLQVINCLSEYQKKHNRKLTLEYTLIQDHNDSDQDILELINLAKFLKAKVNLINLNPHPKINFKPVTAEKLQNIKNRIAKNNVIVTIRFKKGQDICAACGQLSAE
ncbi:23S rRNA (adenine(2503)-C(2))-methyltransferase RlmN [Candidatus Margulisiibacteriota bacterium]